MCENPDCCYYRTETYSSYMYDMLRQNLDNIERFFVKRLNKDDYPSEELYYNAIMYQAQTELYEGNEMRLREKFEEKYGKGSSYDESPRPPDNRKVVRKVISEDGRKIRITRE